MQELGERELAGKLREHSMRTRLTQGWTTDTPGDGKTNREHAKLGTPLLCGSQCV